MATKKNVINFPVKSRQVDNHRLHTINRGDGKMAKKDGYAKDIVPIVKITLLNYESGMQNEYSKKFMSPLIEGLLKRTQLAQAK